MLAGLKFSLGNRTTHKIRSELGGMWPGKPLRMLLALPRGKPSYEQHQPQPGPGPESRSCCPRRSKRRKHGGMRLTEHRSRSR